MEENGTVIEPTFRVNMKQTSKGEWYCEFTVRADKLDELKTKFSETKEFVVSEVKKLNDGG